MSSENELDDSTTLVMDAFEKLQDLDPEHELLRWLSPEVSDDDFRDKFWDKEEDWRTLPGTRVTTYVQAGYFLALKAVLKEEHDVTV